MIDREIPSGVDSTLLLGCEILLKNGVDPKQILDDCFLSAYQDEQYLLGMPTWDYLLSLHVADPIFTKEKLGSLQARIDEVLGRD